jgi:hypothetical protein
LFPFDNYDVPFEKEYAKKFYRNLRSCFYGQ